jgi:protoporphyrinogen oxidase
MNRPVAGPARIVVLGGGPAGIAAAYFAQQQGHDVTLVERSPWIGGKGASRDRNGYILDFGPHAYHPKTRAINEMVVSHAGADYLLGPVMMELIIAGRTLEYPFRPIEGLRKFPISLSARILSDFIAARARRLLRDEPEDSFKSYGEKQFGGTMYRLCFGDYSERVWGLPASELSVELARRKLPRMSVRGLISDFLLKRGSMHAHLFGNDFGYHRRGIGRIYEAIASGIESRGGRVLRSRKVVAFRANGEGRISNVITSGVDGPVDLACDAVVSTIPLNQLEALVDEAGIGVGGQRGKVEFRDIVLAYAVLRRTTFSPAHWTYLVDGRFSFHRISEQKNLSALCCPPDRTMLTLEISAAACPQKPEELRRLVESDLAYFGVKGDEIEEIETIALPDAYPIYRKAYEAELARSLERLSPISNLVSTGRQGLFLDIDMHDAMVLGRAGVNAAIQGEIPRFYRDHEKILREAKAAG